MNRLNDYPVVYKIGGAFVLVLAAAILLGAIALFRLSTVKAAGDETFRDGLPTALALADFRYNVTRYRSFESASSLQVSAEQRALIDKTFVDLSAKADQALVRYRTLASSPQEIELADRLDAVWKDYHQVHEDYMQTYRQSGEKAAADFLLGPSRAAFAKLLSGIEAAVTYNTGVVGDGIAQAGSTYESARYWILGLLIAAAALAVALGLWLARSISLPLHAMTDAMDALAHGNLNTIVPHTDQKDEIGKLAGSMLAFKEQLAAAERSKAEQTEVIVASIGAGLDHLAKGHLSHRITADLSGAFAKLKTDFNAAMGRLQDTLSKVLSSTGQIASGAGEISQAADDLSRRTEQQAANLEQTTAALEEITANVKKTAGNAKEARNSVSAARTVAERGGHVVQTATQAMDAIAQSSKKITDIIGVIDEIAFQTNLLALNAGVEAARAGDAGRGFAVVASEVRALAQRSSEAAKQIKTLIHASGEQVGEGVKLVGESGSTLKHIVDQVEQINALVSEMALAAEQQATGIEQVNAAVAQMDQVTQQNAAMVEESTAASRNLAGETGTLQELVSFFEVGEAVSRPAKVHPKPVAISAPKRVAAGGGAGWDEF